MQMGKDLQPIPPHHHGGCHGFHQAGVSYASRPIRIHIHMHLRAYFSCLFAARKLRRAALPAGAGQMSLIFLYNDSSRQYSSDAFLSLILTVCPMAKIIWLSLPSDVFSYLLSWSDVEDIWNLCLSCKEAWNCIMQAAFCKGILQVREFKW
jgi:hypothetical protein